MEGKEGVTAGVTVIGAEAPSDYHVAPRADNPSQVSGSPALVTPPVSAGGLTGPTEKKRRGRPRKYGPDGSVTMALSPRPISSSIPTAEFSAGKRGRGRGSSSYESKMQKKMGLENYGDLNGTVGSSFMPHVITVNPGEDITMKVISFSQQGPRAICILSANGVISNVTLRQPDSSGGTLTYEGRFEILSLSGSFMPTESQGTRSRSGGMSVSLASPDGRVVGGSVAGLLVAAGPVQVVVGSFLPSNHVEQKPKKQKFDFARASYPTTAAGPDTNAGEEGMSAHELHNTDTTRLNLDSPPIFKGDNWPPMHTMQDSQKLATDINVSLPGG